MPQSRRRILKLPRSPSSAGAFLAASLDDVYHGFFGSWNGCAGCANVLHASSSSSGASTDGAIHMSKSSASSCGNGEIGEIESLRSAACLLPWHGCKHEMLRNHGKPDSCLLLLCACRLHIMQCWLYRLCCSTALLHAVAPNLPSMQSPSWLLSRRSCDTCPSFIKLGRTVLAANRARHRRNEERFDARGARPAYNAQLSGVFFAASR